MKSSLKLSSLVGSKHNVWFSQKNFGKLIFLLNEGLGLWTSDVYQMLIYIDHICTWVVPGTIVLNLYKDGKISQDPVLWNHAPYTKEWATAAEKPKTSVSYKLYVLRKKCIFFNILITIFQNDFFCKETEAFMRPVITKLITGLFY